MSANLSGFEREAIAPGAGRRWPDNTVTWLGGIRAERSKTAPPLRFRLVELFYVITVAAILLALFRALGIFGAVLSFVAAFVFTNVLYPLWRDEDDQEVMFDFVWGMVMPVVCLVFDPFVFKADDLFAQGNPDISVTFEPSLQGLQFYPWSAPAYVLIAWQLACLALWLIAGRLSTEFSAVWSGLLWVGFAFASVVGVALAFPALLGVAFTGIGLLGFTPLFTARAFYRRAKYAGAIAENCDRQEALTGVGICLGILLPEIAFALVRLLATFTPI